MGTYDLTLYIVSLISIKYLTLFPLVIWLCFSQLYIVTSCVKNPKLANDWMTYQEH